MLKMKLLVLITEMEKLAIRPLLIGLLTCFYFYKSQKPTKKSKSQNYFRTKAAFVLVQD